MATLKFKPYIGKEDDFQESAAAYLDHRKILWTHPAGERQLGRMTVTRKSKTYSFSPLGNKMKRKGVKGGVPDILIFEPRGKHGGMAIEIKAGKNRASPEQLIWMHELAKRNWKTLITKSLDELIHEVDIYLNL